MISEIINHIDSKLTFISQPFGLAEMININGDKRPMAYKSNGDFVEVSNFDLHDGVSYWRLLGDIVDNKIEFSGYSCNDVLERTIQLRMVAVILRSSINTEDCQYTVEKLADKIILDIDRINFTVKQEIKAFKIDINSVRFSWDRNKIMDEEYGADININHLYFVLAFDFEIVVTILKSCINDFCDV